MIETAAAELVASDAQFHIVRTCAEHFLSCRFLADGGWHLYPEFRAAYDRATLAAWL